MESIRPAFQGFLDDCAFVLRDEPFIGDMGEVPEGLRQDTVRFHLFGTDGSSVRMLAQPTGAERWFRDRDRIRGFVELIFGEELFGFPLGQELWLGTSDALAWTRLDLTGRTLGRLELGYTPRLASEAEIEAERERRVAEVAAPADLGPPELVERIVESGRSDVRSVPARDRFPAYDAVARGPGPVIWIREYPRPDEFEARWLLIDAAEGLLGRLVLPRDDRIVVGSARSVVILTRDPFDAPLIYILRRSVT